MLFAISSPGNSLDAALLDKINNKTKPLGALGQLEQLALQIGRIQKTLTPALANPQILVFAGDHGAAKAGVSAYPQDVTWQMVENFLAGGAAINVFAKHNGLGLRVIDAGVAHDFGARDGLVDAKVGPGTRNYIEEPAMSAHECAAALVKGAEIARKLADALPVAARPVADDNRNDILNALLALGYNDREASTVMKQLSPDLSTSDGIRQALKLLAKP